MFSFFLLIPDYLKQSEREKKGNLLHSIISLLSWRSHIHIRSLVARNRKKKRKKKSEPTQLLSTSTSFVHSPLSQLLHLSPPLSEDVWQNDAGPYRARLHRGKDGHQQVRLLREKSLCWKRKARKTHAPLQ